jgi:hypothetical protein
MASLPADDRDHNKIGLLRQRDVLLQRTKELLQSSRAHEHWHTGAEQPPHGSGSDWRARRRRRESEKKLLQQQPRHLGSTAQQAARPAPTLEPTMVVGAGAPCLPGDVPIISRGSGGAAVGQPSGDDCSVPPPMSQLPPGSGVAALRRRRARQAATGGTMAGALAHHRSAGGGSVGGASMGVAGPGAGSEEHMVVEALYHLRALSIATGILN